MIEQLAASKNLNFLHQLAPNPVLASPDLYPPDLVDILNLAQEIVPATIWSSSNTARTEVRKLVRAVGTAVSVARSVIPEIADIVHAAIKQLRWAVKESEPQIKTSHDDHRKLVCSSHYYPSILRLTGVC